MSSRAVCPETHDICINGCQKAGCLRQVAAPDSWPWPMSEDAKRWVQSVADSQKPKHERQFDKQAHERFMRGL